jgi:hypothetical protein
VHVRVCHAVCGMWFAGGALAVVFMGALLHDTSKQVSAGSSSPLSCSVR